MFTQSQRVARILFAMTVSVSASTALAQVNPDNPADPPATHVFAPSKPIEGRYIVVFKASVVNPVSETVNIMRAFNRPVHHTYTSALKGFSATLSNAAVQAIRNNPRVDYVEQDQTVSLNSAGTRQTSATWGLDRIDQRDRLLDTQYHYNYTGSGVDAYILDTGILATHVEFTGRLKPGFNVIADANGSNDCHGHGTHVAGTVGGTTWGVAKGVSLIPVRVLDCNGSGSYSGVIAGIDWVANTTARPAVANMSLGGGKSTAMNTAVKGAVGKGITMVVAAGNDSRDACNFSPASEPTAITVAATTSSDAKPRYSNFGTCVDIFAPGSSITSAWIGANDATRTISGTSMAAPHVAGVVALALQANPGATPASVTTFLVTNATPNILTSIGKGSPNLLVYSLATSAP